MRILLIFLLFLICTSVVTAKKTETTKLKYIDDIEIVTDFPFTIEKKSKTPKPQLNLYGTDATKDTKIKINITAPFGINKKYPRYGLINTGYDYIPAITCTYYNQTEVFYQSLHLPPPSIKDSKIKLEFTVTGHPSATRIHCQDPFIDEDAPVYAYLTADGTPTTENEVFINWTEDNHIQNYTQAFSLGRNAGNLSAYHDIIDFWVVGGHSQGDIGNIMDMNQSPKGVYLSTWAWQDDFGLCDNLDNYADGDNHFFQNISMPVFNESNWLVSGNNDFYTSFKDASACDANVYGKNQSGWGLREDPTSEYSAVVFENETVLRDLTTQSRWVFPPFRDDQAENWEQLAFNLSIRVIQWITAPNADVAAPGHTDPAPNIYNVSPPTGYFQTDDFTLNIGAGINDSENITSVVVYINDTVNITNTSGVIGLYNFTVNLGNGTYEFIWEATDNASQATNSTAYLYTINSSPDNLLVFSDFHILSLNSSGDPIGGVESFSTSNLTAIETVNISFQATDADGLNMQDWHLFFTANGTSACATGNKQSATCYSHPSFVQYINGSETTTFDGTDTGGNQGDRIQCIATGSATTQNVTCNIDEHYNPNIAKHYDALYDFSDVKWQDGADQRITKNNILKISVVADNLPQNADEYKLDFRANYSGGINIPQSPLTACACNSSYTTGNPVGDPRCTILGQLLPGEFQDDGTKYRVQFTAEQIDTIGNFQYITLSTNEPNQNRYYYIRTYAAQAAGYTTQWNYSVDTGTSYTNLGDGYESELNINWFVNGADPTATLFRAGITDNSGYYYNSSVFNFTWQIDPNINYAPLVQIGTPGAGDSIWDGTFVNFSVNDPNNNNFTSNVSLINFSTTIQFGQMDWTNFTVWFNASLYGLGNYNLSVISCENDTADLYCGSDLINVSIAEPSTDLFTFPAHFCDGPGIEWVRLCGI